MAEPASAPKYEVEIKSLLGFEGAAEALRKGLKELDPSTKLITSYTQLNHYFEGGNPSLLADRLIGHLRPEIVEQMQLIASGEKISVRTREMNGVAKIVMKASVGTDSSENGVARMEIEEAALGMTLDQLDREVIGAGYKYQAKWSRTREEYEVHGLTVCLDKNAGYGYLVEFEKVIHELTKTDEAKREIEALMKQLGLTELPQDRLERMFAYYNAHWPEYYGTEKVFTIE